MAQIKVSWISEWVLGPEAAVPASFHQLWLRILDLFPALRSEYVQVLVLVVLPLGILASALIADLRFGRRTVAEQGTLTFRPSLAVRCAWIFAVVAIVANLLAVRHHWIVTTANVLALEELVRTFPRRLVVAPDGLRWRNLTGEVSVPWELLACFSQQKSRLGTEVKLYRDDGRSFVVQSMIFPGWKQIVRRISLSLAERHLIPSPTSPQTTAERLQRIVAPACLVLIAIGDRLPTLR